MLCRLWQTDRLTHLLDECSPDLRMSSSWYLSEERKYSLNSMRFFRLLSRLQTLTRCAPASADPGVRLGTRQSGWNM